MTTTTGTELVRMDEATLAILGEMVDKDDTTGISIPIAKINYVSVDEGSHYPKGTWVVGQQKDTDGIITEQGKAINALVTLAVRNRFSFYDRKDTSRNCSSCLHKAGDSVRGNKYGNICGSGCQYRAKDLTARCKAQKVILGVAYTHEGEGIDCMSYIQGANYVPFTDYYKKLTKAQAKGGPRDIPPFSHPTILGTEKQKFDSTVYYVATFTQGPLFDMDKIEAFRVRRDGAKQIINALNAAHAERHDPVPTVVPPEVSPDADVPF